MSVIRTIVISLFFYSVVSIVSEIPTGLLADKIGQKSTVSIGLLFSLLAIPVVFFLPTVLGLYIAYGIWGLGGAFLTGSDEALFYESCKKEKKINFKKEYGSRKSYFQLGFILSAGLTALFLHFGENLSYDPLFYGSILSMFLAFLLSLGLDDIIASIRQKEKGKDLFIGLKESIHLMKNNDVVKILTISSIIMYTGLYFMKAVYQPLFEQNAVPVYYLGVVLVLGSVVNLICMKYVYKLEGYLSFNNILLLLYGLMAMIYI